MDILSIIQTATLELGLPEPAIVVGSNDIQVKQLLSLVNRDANDLFRDKIWTVLQKEFIVNVEIPIDRTGDILNGSAVVSNVDTTGLSTDYAVSGTGQPQAQRIAEIIDATSLRLEMLSTEDAPGTILTFAKDTYSLPTDFNFYIGDTWWDRTNHWRLIGPDSAQYYQFLRSGIVVTGPRRHWNQIGLPPDVFRIWPAPTAQDSPAALVFMYVSNGWVITQEGTFQSSFTADTDSPVSLDQALILGVKWRWQQIKGASYGALQQEYLDYVARERARDGGNPSLYLSKRPNDQFLISLGNVQDGGWPGNV